MIPKLIDLAGCWCTTLQFNAFRFAAVKNPNHVCAWYPGLNSRGRGVVSQVPLPCGGPLRLATLLVSSNV